MTRVPRHGPFSPVRNLEAPHSDRGVNDRYTHVLIEAYRAAAEQTAALVRKAGERT